VTRSLHGTSDGDVYYWAVTHQPRLGKKLTLAEWTERELCDFENIAATGSMKEREGASQILQDLSEQAGYAVVQGVVTGGSERQMNANLSVVTNSDLIDFRINANTVCNGTSIAGKSYISGCYEARRVLQEKYGIDKPQMTIAIAIEDSPSGVRRIRADTPGCYAQLDNKNFFGVQWVIPGEKEDRSEPHLPNLYYAEPKPEALLRQIHAIQQQVLAR
jgi:hypothetical protein